MGKGEDVEDVEGAEDVEGLEAGVEEDGVVVWCLGGHYCELLGLK